jgi:hypothetical protein
MSIFTLAALPAWEIATVTDNMGMYGIYTYHRSQSRFRDYTTDLSAALVFAAPGLLNPSQALPRHAPSFTGVAKSNVLALGSSNRDANPSSLFRAWRIRCSERCGSHLYLSCEYTTTGACKRVSRVVIHIHHQRVTKKSVDCIILGLTMYYFIVTVPPFCRRWSHHTTIMLLHL